MALFWVHCNPANSADGMQTPASTPASVFWVHCNPENSADEVQTPADTSTSVFWVHCNDAENSEPSMNSEKKAISAE